MSIVTISREFGSGGRKFACAYRIKSIKKREYVRYPLTCLLSVYYHFR